MLKNKNIIRILCEFGFFVIHLYQQKQTIMSKLNKLIEKIESGRKTEGDIQINGKGVKYKYETFFIDYPTKWDAKLFEDAQKEHYGKEARKLGKSFDRIDFDKTQIKLDYPNFKGEKFGKLSLNRLVIL